MNATLTGLDRDRLIQQLQTLAPRYHPQLVSV